MTHFARKSAVLAAAFLIFSLATPAFAAGLTSVQVNAIIGLLQSFGAEQSVIANVSAALGGTPVTTAPANVSCVNLSHNLYLGSSDIVTGGEVSKLQQFLNGQVTGYYGPQTTGLVQQWQSSHHIVSSGSPDTAGYGAVGPQTRSVMRCIPDKQSTAQDTGGQQAQSVQVSGTANSSGPLLPANPVSDGRNQKVTTPSSQQFIYGINAQYLDDTAAAQIAESHAALRLGFVWDFLEHQKGQWTYGLYDTQVQRAQAHNIPILGMLDFSAQWALLQDPSCTSRQWDTCQPQNIDAYLNYVATVVKRYQYVKYWEVWNEENYESFWHNPDPVAYVNMLKQTYAVIKQNNPNAQVVLGGVGLLDPTQDIKYISGIYAAGGKDYFDIMNIHPYRQPKGPDEKYDYNNLNGQDGQTLKQVVASVKSLMDASGDSAKKIWISEIGWQTAGDARAVSYDQQANYLQATFADLKSLDYVGAAFWYQLTDTCTDTSNFECWVGIVGQSGPKPALGVFENLQSSAPSPVSLPTFQAPILTASPALSQVTIGQANSITWSAQQVTGCSFSGPGIAVPFISAVSGVIAQRIDSIAAAKAASVGSETYTLTCNALGGMQSSKTISVIVSCPPGQTVVAGVCAVSTPPLAPSSISYACSADGTSVSFSWPNSTGATNYTPFIKNVATCASGWSADSNTPGTCYQSGVTGNSITYSGLTPGTSYIAWVHAANAAGVNWKSMASTDWFLCAAPKPPPAPVSLSYACSADGTNVTLSWPSSVGATQYWPFIKNVSTCSSGWTADSGAPGTCYQNGTAATTATYAGIVSGTSYIAWVHAGNAAGVNWNLKANTDWFACVANH